MATSIGNGAAVPVRQPIEVHFRSKVVEIGVQRNFLIVVVHFSMRKSHMSDGKVEYADLAVALAGRHLREVTPSRTIGLEMRHRVLDQDFPQRDLAVQRRLNLEADRQLVDLEQRAFRWSLGPAHGDVIKMRRRWGQTEIETTNLGGCARSDTHLLGDLAERIVLETAAPQDSQCDKTCQNPNDDSLPLHDCS